MAEWRVLRGWTEEELRVRLRRLEGLPLNFDPASMTGTQGWRRQSSTAIVAREEPGPPETSGPFSRLCLALRNYEFSDPAIVTAHFDPGHPFAGRLMLLEIRILGLRYLTGTRIGAVREEYSEGGGSVRVPVRHPGGAHRGGVGVVPDPEGPWDGGDPLLHRSPVADG